MKILGIMTGKDRGNSSLLAKQALLAAQAEGAEVELVNVRHLDIRSCIDCKKCHDFQNAIAGHCILNDDLSWIEEKIFESDGVIVVCPAYEKAPPGEFKLLMDRTGPGHDVYFWKMAKKMRDENPGKYDETKPVDERAFKKRFATFIGHGGSEWVHLLMPMMMGWSTSMGFTPVDKVLIPWAISINESDDAINRVYESGKYVAQCCKDPDADHPFFGEKGYCPVCHNDTFVLGPGTKVSCAVCGVDGTLDISNGEILVKTTEAQRAMSHILDSGRKKHYDDLSGFGERIRNINWDVIKPRNNRIYDAIAFSKPEKS